MAPYTADLVFWKKQHFQNSDPSESPEDQGEDQSEDNFEEEPLPLPINVTYFEGDAEFNTGENPYEDDDRQALHSTESRDLENASSSSRLAQTGAVEFWEKKRRSLSLSWLILPPWLAVRKRTHAPAIPTASSSRLAQTGAVEFGEKKRRRPRTISILLILLCLGVVLFTVGIIVRKRKRQKDSINAVETSFTNQTYVPTNSPVIQPTAAPLPSPTRGPISSPTATRIEKFSQILGGVTNPNRFREGNPEKMALEWLAIDDGAELDPDTTDVREIEERYIAALLYFATNGDDWTTDLNFLSETSICTWNFVSVGIICDSSGFVTGLSIVDNNLVGPLPSEINGFSSLERMNLYYNQLTGPIPELDQLSKLKYVDLDRNQFTGLLPQSIFNLPSLETLLLLNNRELTGKLPPLLASSRLQKVSFYNCSLSGSLPASWGDVSSLTFLQFFDNALTGSIPSSLTTLPDLELFSFRGNKLTGTIPPFSTQRNLATISLGENSLRGSLPPGFVQLRGLEMLYLQGNQLSGTIPRGISRLPRLKHAWLFDNSFQGPLPDFFGNPTSLEQLYLHGNQFTGTMDSLLQRAPTSIQFLDVSDNRALQGTLSSDISRMTSLFSLNVSHTALTGRLPDEVNSLGLKVLSLQATGITGDLTESLCTAQASFNILSADCGGSSPQIACGCCTECCTTIDSNNECLSVNNLM